jgi:ubiquinone biosynthesis protein
MQTRPELILLQKSMVIVEGVARSLNPSLNMWVAAEPIAKDWVESNLSVMGRLKDAGDSAAILAKLAAELPVFLTSAERAVTALGVMAEGGVRLNDETIERLAQKQSRHGRWRTAALWVAAIALAVLALGQAGIISP